MQFQLEMFAVLLHNHCFCSEHSLPSQTSTDALALLQRCSRARAV